MAQPNKFYVIKLDINEDNYYTYWRLWCSKDQIEQLVASREREYGVSKVSYEEGDEEDIQMGETHLIDEEGVVWAKTTLRAKKDV